MVRQKSLYLDCDSGVDPESSICELDIRSHGNDGFGVNVKLVGRTTLTKTRNSFILMVMSEWFKLISLFHIGAQIPEAHFFPFAIRSFARVRRINGCRQLISERK